MVSGRTPQADILINASSLQDLPICDAKGRDCIEKNSLETFYCNTTCVGIYAYVQWVGKNIEDELKDEEPEEIMEIELEEKIEPNLKKIFLLLEKKMNLMKNEMDLMKTEIKNDIDEKIKIATRRRGEGLDKKKYKRLISEYRKSKSKNVKHFRFKSAANLSTFGIFNTN